MFDAMGSTLFLTCGLAILVISGTGCMGVGGGAPIKTVKSANYTVSHPDAPWQVMSEAKAKMDADHAFMHPETGSAFYVRSECHLYKDASLGQLLGGLKRLFSNVRVLEEQDTSLVGRSAKESLFVGELDGVEVKVNITVVKKHACYFDFVFIAPPDAYKKDHPTYKNFVTTFSL